MKKVLLAAALSAPLLTACATTYSVTPVAGQDVETRYDRGMATLSSAKPNGVVRVSPLGFNEHGQIKFGVAAFNRTGEAVDFGVEDVSLAGMNGAPIPVYSANQLKKQEQGRAAWAAAAVALAGASSAYAAQQNAYSTTNATMTTPLGGVYVYRAQRYDATAAAIGVGAASAATAVSLDRINSGLDRTLASISGVVLQRTTIDPQASYGGEVVGDRLKGKYPQDVLVQVRFAGDEHSLRFQVAKD